MKTFLVCVLCVVAALPAASQISLKFGPKVNGIALGAARQEVIRKLGKPSSVSKRIATVDECVGGTEMTLKYPGLEFRLWDHSDNPNKFTVGMFEATSPKWSVSGAKVGQPRRTIKKLFGTRSFDGNDGESGLPFWSYRMDEEKGPGSTTFTFRKGKLVSIAAMWLMC